MCGADKPERGLLCGRLWTAGILFLAGSLNASAETSNFISADAALLESEHALEMIDKGRSADVWDASSSVMKGSVTREDFASSTDTDRLQSGPIKTRTWLSVSQVQYTPENPQGQPPGSYMNIAYLSLNSLDKKFRELISLRLEADRTWRVSGYVLQQPSKK